MKQQGRKTSRVRSGATLAENLTRTLAIAELIAPVDATKPLPLFPGAEAIDLVMIEGRQGSILSDGRHSLDPLAALPADFQAKVLRAINEYDAEFFVQMAHAVRAYSVRKDGTCEAAAPGKFALIVFAMGMLRPAPDTSKMGPSEILVAVEKMNRWGGQRPDLATLREWLTELGIPYKKGKQPKKTR